MRKGLRIEDYVAGVRAGDRTVLGRAITLVESNRSDHRRQAQELLTALQPFSGGAVRVGVSGVPGVGKSTLVDSLGQLLVERGHRVAVLAVDPTSDISGGSLLGDKTRMVQLAASERVFIRPSPTGGSLGGVARKTRESIVVCEAAGHDVVLVETVGVGQSETAVAGMVDTLLLLMLSRSGDELQGIKRGILELADIVAVNKADGDNREAAERARRELESALAILRPAGSELWTPPVVTCSAMYGDGLEQLWDLVSAHRRRLEEDGRLEQKRRQQRLRWMWSLVDEAVRSAVREHPAVAAEAPRLQEEVLAGRVTPTRAAELILEAFGHDRD